MSICKTLIHHHNAKIRIQARIFKFQIIFQKMYFMQSYVWNNSLITRTLTNLDHKLNLRGICRGITFFSIYAHLIRTFLSANQVNSCQCQDRKGSLINKYYPFYVLIKNALHRFLTLDLKKKNKEGGQDLTIRINVWSFKNLEVKILSQHAVNYLSWVKLVDRLLSPGRNIEFLLKESIFVL